MFRRPLVALVFGLFIFWVTTFAENLARFDDGAVGAWQKILKLQSVASIMQTTAHPDDEQGDMLALIGRGKGVRTALLTLTRGEAGDNAIGPELFDALGLIRTDELAAAGQSYGLDEQYFTAAADYGFSKRADEALAKWDRHALLRDMVRAIRASRPLVVISRWQGTARDGHGQHQAAGLLTPEAVAAAADPHRFPELANEGLRPWRVRKVYSAGWSVSEDWHIVIDPGAYDPLRGDSFTNVARAGLSLQRSQTAGRLVRTFGPTPLYYRRIDTAGAHESDFFDGLETSISAVYRLLGRPEPAGASERLRRIAEEAALAHDAFRFTDPTTAAPALARGLIATREALLSTTDEDVAFLLRIKERQFEGALTATLGLELVAFAEPPGTKLPSGPYAAFAQPPTLGAITGGASVDVAVSFVKQSSADVALEDVEIAGAAGQKHIKLAGTVTESRPQPCAVTPGPCTLSGRVTIEIPIDAPVTRPYFSRRGLADTRYTLRPGSPIGRPWDAASMITTARYRIAGVTATVSTSVMRREAMLPDGYAAYEVEVLPPVSLRISPAVSIVRANDAARAARVRVDLTSFTAEPIGGVVRLQAPVGWTVAPASVEVTVAAAGDRREAQFEVTAPAGASDAGELAAVFTTGGHDWRLDYTTLRHRDLPVRYFVRDAGATIAIVDLQVDRHVRVGYVMGIGDEVPAALEQLGARVSALTPDDLASGDLTGSIQS